METIIYRIDDKDIIVDISANWLAFAQENEAGDRCNPNNVIHRPIWDFILGDETVNLYKLIFKKVRTEWKVIAFPFRCDSPGLRRFLDLEIAPLSKGILQFRSILIRTERREYVKLLDKNIGSSDKHLPICSLCKKAEISKGKWVEVEDAIAELKLFEQTSLPKIAHALCSECDALYRERINKIH